MSLEDDALDANMPPLISKNMNENKIKQPLLIIPIITLLMVL
jgi:hypothetical protein